MLFVAVPSPPVVRINPFNTSALAGVALTVICSVIPQIGIMYNNTTLTLMWTGDGGTPLPSRESFGPIIHLSPVHTSHDGEYTCTARLNIPEARVDVSGTNTTAINVQSMKNTLSSAHCIYLLITRTSLLFFSSSRSNIDHHRISKRFWLFPRPDSNIHLSD